MKFCRVKACPKKFKKQILTMLGVKWCMIITYKKKEKERITTVNVSKYLKNLNISKTTVLFKVQYASDKCFSQWLKCVYLLFSWTDDVLSQWTWQQPPFVWNHSEIVVPIQLSQLHHSCGPQLQPFLPETRRKYIDRVRLKTN